MQNWQQWLDDEENGHLEYFEKIKHPEKNEEEPPPKFIKKNKNSKRIPRPDKEDRV